VGPWEEEEEGERVENARKRRVVEASLADGQARETRAGRQSLGARGQSRGVSHPKGVIEAVIRPRESVSLPAKRCDPRALCPPDRPNWGVILGKVGPSQRRDPRA
jgi:hypothetical protein